MNPSKNACRLCLQNKQLIKAHIIPEAFFRLLRDGNVPPEMHSNTPGSFPKRMPIGTYDPTILCLGCDQKMAPWDDYGQQVLIHRFQQALEMTHAGKLVAWKLEDIEYRKLKLFFMAILWRASVSSQPFYKRISLGPFENRIRVMILNEDLGDAQDFSITLSRFGDVETTSMLDPHPTKFDGINYCQLYLSGYVAYIKVDKRPTPTFLTDCYFQKNKPLIVLVRSLQGSSDGRVILEIAESALAYRAKQKVSGSLKSKGG